MKDQTDTQINKHQFRFLGGTGSVIEFRVQLHNLDTAKPQSVTKTGRIADMTEPLQVVMLDEKGRDGKTVAVELKDVVEFISPAVDLKPQEEKNA